MNNSIKKNTGELAYLSLLKEVLQEGAFKNDRTGTGTYSLFGRQIKFNLQEGFPLLTTKKIFTKGVIVELLWFLAGDTNIKFLVENNVNIWNEWPYRTYLKKNPPNTKNFLSQEDFIENIKKSTLFAKKWGELGPVYGYQWRNWETKEGKRIDQITNLIDTIKSNPESRRLIVTAWNVSDIEKMAISGLPPCHTLFQFYVSDNKLSCQLYQRSADIFLGVPFNIASYSLLTHLVARATNKEVGDFVHTFGDVHLYANHKKQAAEQLERKPRSFPNLVINTSNYNIFSYKLTDFKFENYNPYPPIKAPVAV